MKKLEKPPSPEHKKLAVLESMIDYLKENKDVLISRLPSDLSVHKIREKFSSWREAYIENNSISPEILDKKNRNMISKKILTENQQCRLCQRRMISVRDFFKLGVARRANTLIANYNGPYRRFKRTDRSHRYFFNSLQEDLLMTNILNCSSLAKLGHFSFLELPGCHFDGEKSMEDEWRKRAQNCQIHLTNKIKRHKIQRVILVGLTPIWLLGQERTAEMADTTEQSQIELADFIVPCMVLHSPMWWFRLKRINQSEYTRQLEGVRARVRSFVF